MTQLQHLKSPLLVAHRGGAGLWLENSLPAFMDAIKQHYDAIECDIQLTHDQKLVVYHDFTLNPRYTDNLPSLKTEEAIQNLSSDDLKKLTLVDAAQGICSPIPFMEDLLALLAQSKNRPFLFAEIKTSPLYHTQEHVECLVGALIALAEYYGYLENMTLLSFDWRGLFHAQRQAPHIPLTFIYCDDIHEPQENNLWLGPYILTKPYLPSALKEIGSSVISVPHHLMTPALMESCRAVGLKTNVWTV
ncbi:MAG: glycerophosphodiester phosphodiesterase, partial [Candidatus Nucleicultricaceae bacterium]